ncbi:HALOTOLERANCE DETERMINANT 3, HALOTOLERANCE DETERMINANT 3B [Hibiscus trionum]|uniref:phosphopantothenoylcysteine decarboxylase n=1 Tax=Hibiscus trionum TaxID=183268 RepID=A0A9W7ME17_HIBTR|nr:HALOTOLERANCE DETERMINANT 3, HALOTOLERANCE DETERMINANT 3B [Hibiscus trionum]
MAHPDPGTRYAERGKAPMDPAPRKPRILLAACGCVAAIKFVKICEYFCDWAEVKAVATQASLRFIDIASLPNNVDLYTDEHERSFWRKLGDNVLHIELRRWADLMVIAPLSANTLAKIAGGMSDNLLTCVVRSWDHSKPMFIAPGMHTFTWRNPFTEKHLMSVDELGFCFIPGDDSMAEPSEIDSTVRVYLESRPLRLN